MEIKYYQKPIIKTVQLKTERPIQDSWSSGEGGGSRELRSVWKDDEE